MSRRLRRFVLLQFITVVLLSLGFSLIIRDLLLPAQVESRLSTALWVLVPILTGMGVIAFVLLFRRGTQLSGSIEDRVMRNRVDFMLGYSEACVTIFSTAAIVSMVLLLGIISCPVLIALSILVTSIPTATISLWLALIILHGYEIDSDLSYWSDVRRSWVRFAYPTTVVAVISIFSCMLFQSVYISLTLAPALVLWPLWGISSWNRSARV